MNCSIDQLNRLTVLSLAITHGKGIFDFNDIKSIRESCKSLKEVVDYEAFICKKLTIAVDGNPQGSLNNLKAIAGSPLLRFIRYLNLSYNLDDEPYDDLRLPRYAKPILRIVQNVSSHLYSISFSTHLPPHKYSFGRRILRGDLKFPALRLLMVCPVNDDTIATCRSSFYSMYQLESLSLTCSKGTLDAGVTVADLQVLAEAPFIRRLKILILTLYRPWKYPPRQYADPDVLVPLAAVFQKTKDLQELELQYAPSLSFLNGASLQKLSELRLLNSYYDIIDYSPLRSLGDLSIEGCKCTMSSLNALAAAPDGVSQLPTLQRLTLVNPTRVTEDDEDSDDEDELMRDCWHWLGRLNMPRLMSITLKLCSSYTQADYFRIGYAAANLPNLNSFYLCYPLEIIADHVDDEIDVYNTFFSSTLAAQLLEFEVEGTIFSPVGFQLLLENAANMDDLVAMEIPLVSQQQFHAFLQAGREGGWPRLRKGYLTWEVEPADIPADAYQEEEFEEIWPDAHISIFPLLNE